MLSPPAQRLSLPILPADVLTYIFTRCELRDLLNLSLVCRLLKDALDSNAYLLRYKILLAVHGLVDVPSPHQGKLSLLMKHHSRVVDGVYTNTGSRYFSCAETSSLRGQEATGPDTDQWRLSLAFGGTISYTILKPLEGVIDIYEPSHLPGDHTVSHWSVPVGFFPGVDTWGVCVDTTQDLLLVAKRQPHGETDWDITVHVRSLKRPDAPHPRARSHSLCTAPSEPECYGVSNIQIHDQFVIWMLDTLFGRQVEEHLFPGPGFITYTLLDAAHILVTSDRWDELRVYRFDPPDESADGVLRLGFPFEDRCRPRIQQSSIPVLPPNVPFWPDAKLRILTVFYYSMVSTPPIGALMIPYTTFRRLLHPKSTTKPTYTPPLRVPWEQWGPQGSVDLQVPADKRVVLLNSYPYGSRVSFNAFEMPGGRLGPDWWKQMDVVTFDLNPYGDKYADNPYVACPPRPARWSAEQVKQWIRDESAIPHSASSVPRHQESPTLYDSTMIAHCYGFTEFFPIQLPASVHEIGFRTHFLMEKNGSEAIESAD